jgi:hypothetical protein
MAIEDTTKRWPVQRFLTDHNAVILQVGLDEDNSSERLMGGRNPILN